MAITALSELEAALADRLARADFTTSVKDECIAMCESEMQRELRTLDMETKSATFSIAGTEYVTVPTDFLQVRSFMLNSTPRMPLEYMPDDTISASFASSGKPKYYNISGGNFRFGPTPDGTYTATLVYYAKIPALNLSNTTNWMLTAHPDAYLYGSLKHAAIRLQDVNAAQSFDALFRSVIASIQRSTDMNRWGGPGMAVRVG